MYKLHRETFYLAQDFFDRYMATQHDIVKTLLQLIGISSLFIAAKLEVRGLRVPGMGLTLPRSATENGGEAHCLSTMHILHFPK